LSAPTKQTAPKRGARYQEDARVYRRHGVASPSRERDNSLTYTYPQYSYPALGQTWTVFGFLEKARFFPAVEKPWCLWTNIYNCKRLN